MPGSYIFQYMLLLRYQVLGIMLRTSQILVIGGNEARPQEYLQESYYLRCIMLDEYRLFCLVLNEHEVKTSTYY